MTGKILSNEHCHKQLISFPTREQTSKIRKQQTVT